jgi:hypothetical protein
LVDVKDFEFVADQNKERKSKESWLRGPGFNFTSEVWCLPFNTEWNNGMMER